MFEGASCGGWKGMASKAVESIKCLRARIQSCWRRIIDTPVHRRNQIVWLEAGVNRVLVENSRSAPYRSGVDSALSFCGGYVDRPARSGGGANAKGKGSLRCESGRDLPASPE